MKTSLLGQKSNYLRRKLRITQYYFLSTSLKIGKCLGKVFIWWKQLFLGQTSEMGQILQEMDLPPQNEPHTAKLSFSGVLKQFLGNLLNFSFESKK